MYSEDVREWARRQGVPMPCCKWSPHIKVQMVAPYEYEACGEYTHAEWVKIWKIRIAIWGSPFYVAAAWELLKAYLVFMGWW